jgi:hypothetical protein
MLPAPAPGRSSAGLPSALLASLVDDEREDAEEGAAPWAAVSDGRGITVGRGT